jgi:ribosomal protein S18 acetylase RimI-like enzyme
MSRAPGNQKTGVDVEWRSPPTAASGAVRRTADDPHSVSSVEGAKEDCQVARPRYALRVAANEIWRMRRSLTGPFPAPAWPDGVTVRTFTPGDAPGVHDLLEQAYARGGGSVAPYDEWLPAMTTDSEFDAELWFVACSGEEIAGVALCWTSAFVKDLAVSAAWRRRGLGTALVLHCLAAFAGRGAAALDLKVDSDNPSGAVRLYEQLGFRVVERIPV